MKELFGQPYDESDPLWVARGFFDRIYSDNLFLHVLELLVYRCGFGTDGAYCSFPDWNSFYPEEHFHGVQVLYGAPPDSYDSKILAEEDFIKILTEAVDIFCARHQEHRQRVADLLGKWNGPLPFAMPNL